ncbi:protein trichome birefringence-like 14 [Syzygium oleosum]|uniref:protein trichome birefringence-like 14 n=1 Tax=Syzygium oleosum TaxID=219896 RepID=UPI0011D1B57B|nr:protein trichome birefringence-like 14 [Syzygium oleosum]XP_056166720.1 protein trichome birefringence-like 14 [Syzygium oleosum]XP_056166721.1 protein trichome birefringence-like 14 [Syzygium oleosum]
MKGSFYGLRGKQLSLVLITIVCMSILVWAWEKNPLRTSFVRPQNIWLPRTSDIQTEAHLETAVRSQPPESSGKDESSIAEEVTIKDLNKGQFDVAPSMGSPWMTDVGANLTSRVEEKEELAKGIESVESKRNETAEVSFSVTESRGKEEHDSGVDNSKQEERIDFQVPPGSEHFNATLPGENNEKPPILEKNQAACNFAKGKWVVDDRRPLYSGFSCKRWLSGMWACRLTQRMNFDYEMLKWQPKDCQIEEFEGSKFLKRMQDKTLAFVGDSLGRQQFQSLMCMITGGKDRLDVLDVGREYGLVKAKGAIRPDGWVYRFPSTNTTVLYYWSASLCDLEPLNVTNPATEYAMHLDRPPAFLQRFIQRFDVLVLNTGHHWNRGKLNANRWIMYVGGARNTNKKIAEIARAKDFTIHSIVSWVNSQLPKYPHLKAFYRSISPRHFVNGDWNTGGSCDNEIAMSIGKEVLQDESSDVNAESAVRGTKVRLLDITAPSQVRDEGHISRFSIKGTRGVQDCLHWCLPGVPDTWNELLFAQI